MWWMFFNLTEMIQTWHSASIPVELAVYIPSCKSTICADKNMLLHMPRSVQKMPPICHFQVTRKLVSKKNAPPQSNHQDASATGPAPSFCSIVGCFASDRAGTGSVGLSTSSSTLDFSPLVRSPPNTGSANAGALVAVVPDLACSSEGAVTAIAGLVGAAPDCDKVLVSGTTNAGADLCFTSSSSTAGSSGIATAVLGIFRLGMTRSEGIFKSLGPIREERRRRSSCVSGFHSLWSGTPSAAGSSPSSSRSSPQNVLLRLGAGVTGRLGRSIADGKSVRSKLSRRLLTACTRSSGSGWFEGESTCCCAGAAATLASGFADVGRTMVAGWSLATTCTFPRFFWNAVRART